MSRWLLVELHADLAKHRTTHNTVVLSVAQVNGVQDVTDISVISKQTADEWLSDWYLPDDQVLLPEKKRRPRRNGVD